MVKTVIYGFGEVQNSITSAEVDQDFVLDLSQPFTFFDFLKNIRGPNSTIEYNDRYLEYLKKWYELKGESEETTQSLVTNQYVNLLRDISLNYTTNEEKRFLQNIDFSLQEDLQIVIPFYSRKLKEIVLFIKEKRDEAKYVTDFNSIRGTNLSIEKVIFNTIINDSQVSSLSSLVDNLQIEVEEFVDTYTGYYNILPEPVNEPATRDVYYSSNTNVIDGDLFINFDKKLRESIFNNAFLTEIGKNFTVNVDVLSLISCNPDDPLRAQLNSQCVGNIDLETKLNLQKRLIQKFIGTDYYYLSSNSLSQVVSGVLFQATNPTGNYLNIRNSSTQVIPSEQLKCLRDVGLFFKPDTKGLLKFTSTSSSYEFDPDLIEPDTTYIFPDPSLYGNVYYKGDTPVVFQVSNRYNVNNISKTFAAGDPIITSSDQPIYGYHSNQQDKVDINLVELFNAGYVHTWRQDIYGNQYALFKSQPNQFNRTFESEEIAIKDLLISGGAFFSPSLGYTDDFLFTSYTGDLSSSSGWRYLNFRNFQPYNEFESSESIVSFTTYLKDGGIFTFSNNDPVPDSIESDSSLLPNTNVPGYFYRSLTEGGLTSSFQRPVLSAIGFEPTFSVDNNFILSGGDMYDCYYFDTDNSVENGYDYVDSIPFIDATLSSYHSVVSTVVSGSDSSVSIRNSIGGRMFVGDYLTGSVYPLSSDSALYTLFSKYPLAVQTSVFHSNITDFNLYYDHISLKTPDYFVIDKITYDADGFGPSQTTNSWYTLSAGVIEMTNTFMNDREVLYAIITLSGSKIVPNIYNYSLYNSEKVRVFPNNVTTYSSVSADFDLSYSMEGDIPVKIITPRLSYSSRNMIWALSYIVYNQNNLPYVFVHKFDIVGDVLTFLSSKVYKPGVMTVESIDTSTAASLSSILGTSTIESGAIQL